MMSEKNLLVLGASSDIGLHYIKKYHFNYDKIFCHYNSSFNELEKVKLELGEKIILLQGDFSNPESTDEFISNLLEHDTRPSHVLHLSAPKVVNQRFTKTPWDSFQNGFDTQVKSIVLILQKIIPSMVKNKFGKIVFTLSSFTVGTPPKYLSDYVSLKYLLLGLMKSLAVEYIAYNIYVNAVSPSMVETKFLEKIPRLVVEQTAGSSPLMRNARPQDILPAIEYLMSSDSNFVTGQNLIIAGGTIV